MTDRLVVSGDLDPEPDRLAGQLAGWQRAGITDILDVRGEWSDEDVVADLAPEMNYWHVPTHDDGGTQDDAWFDTGVTVARTSMGRDGSRLLVHCHMGVNRAPSMALRILLDQHRDVVDALDAIRRARPIAAIAYAEDALRHAHRVDSSATGLRRDLDRVQQWQQMNRIDIATVIRRIRRAEAA